MHAHRLLHRHDRVRIDTNNGITNRQPIENFTPFRNGRGRCSRRLSSGDSRCMAEHSQSNSSQSTPTNSILSVFCPLLKAFSGGDPAAPRARWAEVATSGFASMARLPFGTTVGPAAALRDGEPKERLRIYAFEACPFCRRVAESITDLDLEVEYYPTPKDAVRHRQIVQEAGGQQQFPFMLDPNTEPPTVMYESEAIVRYLYDRYGGGSEPPKGLLLSIIISGWVPTLLRVGRGMVRYGAAIPDAPPQLLQLWDYDGNQFARLVREALCELEIPYVRVSAGKGSTRRAELQQLSGSTRVPYLVDPNTGVEMGESEEIVKYLFDTYSIKPASVGGTI